MGFHNAHAVKLRRKHHYHGRIVGYDHVHENMDDNGIPYEFISAEQLLVDFFERVNTIINSVNKR